MINSNGQSAGEASGSGGVCGKLMHSGPVWMRIYYSTPDNQDCRLLAETVKCQWQPQFFFFLFNNRKMIYFQLGKFRPGRKGLLWLERSQMTICILPCPWYSHAAIETISCKETRCAGILGRLIRRPPVWLQLFFSVFEFSHFGEWPSLQEMEDAGHKEVSPSLRPLNPPQTFAWPLLAQGTRGCGRYCDLALLPSMTVTQEGWSCD